MSNIRSTTKNRTMHNAGELLVVPAHSVIAERVLSGTDCCGIKTGCVFSRAVNKNMIQAVNGLWSQSSAARDATQTQLYTELKAFLQHICPTAPTTPKASEPGSEPFASPEPSPRAPRLPGALAALVRKDDSPGDSQAPVTN